MSRRSPVDPGSKTVIVTEQHDTRKNTAAESPLRSPENITRSGVSDAQDANTAASATTASHGLIPSATTAATKAVSNLASGVKSVVVDAVKWAEKKADDLQREADEVGPYASPATCVPSDLDPLASGVMPALEAEKSKEIATRGRELETGKDAEAGERARSAGNKR